MLVSIAAILMFVHLKNKKLLIFSLAFFTSLMLSMMLNSHLLIFTWTPFIIIYLKDLKSKISFNKLATSLLFSFILLFTTNISISADAMSYALWANIWRTNPSELFEFNLLIDHIITLDVVLSSFRMTNILNTLQYMVFINSFFVIYAIFNIYDWSKQELWKISISMFSGFICMALFYNSSYVGMSMMGLLLFIIGLGRGGQDDNKIILLLSISSPRSCLLALVYSIIKKGFSSYTTFLLVLIIGAFVSVSTGNMIFIIIFLCLIIIHFLLILKVNNLIKRIDEIKKIRYDYQLLLISSIMVFSQYNGTLEERLSYSVVILVGWILLFHLSNRNPRMLVFYNPITMLILMKFAYWIPGVLTIIATDIIFILLASTIMFQLHNKINSIMFLILASILSLTNIHSFRLGINFSSSYPDKYYEEAIDFIEEHYSGMVVSDQTPSAISEKVYSIFHRHHRAAIFYAQDFSRCDDIYTEIMCVNYWSGKVDNELKHVYEDVIIFISKEHDYEALTKVKGMNEEFENTNYLILKLNNV